jgi:hypothetical protein
MKKLLVGLIVGLCFPVCAGVFEDAKWIGVPGDCLPFYPDYLPVFKIDCDVDLTRGDAVSLIYGANDPRLMNRNLNIYNLKNPKDSSEIRIEINLNGTVSVYRKGYHPSDNGGVPVASFKNCGIKKGKDHLSVASNLGITDIFLNGEKIGNVVLNPIGKGGDYLAFPVLAEMKVDIPKGSNAKVEKIEIRNFREPGNVIYNVPGVFTATSEIPLEVRSMPRVRTSFEIPQGKNLK